MTTNKKITELAELTEANLSDDDVLAIVDVSAGTTNKVRKSTLASALAGVASLSATSPVTVSAGTGAVNIAVTTIPITSGGTGATTAADARTNLGVPAATDVVTGPASATDSALALFNGTTGKIIKDSTYTITSAGAALIDDASASAQRTTLGAAASGSNSDITALTGLTTNIAVADGGTGASTLTDGGVLLGSGTGAVTAMATMADGEMIVGDGTTDPVLESGATLRTSIGVAIGSDVQAFDADNAVTDALQTFTLSQRGTITTDNDLSFDLNVTNNFKSTPSGTGTLTFTNHTAGQSGNILLINSGGHAISLAATTKGDANLATTISTAGTYWLSYYDDGTNAYVVTSAVFA